MRWLTLPGHVPAKPQRPSQIMHESTAPDDTGQYIFITMERVSTGGTRYSQQFQRQQTDGGTMSVSERTKKKRVSAALFPHQNAAARTRDAGRKRDAKWRRREDSDAEDDWQCQLTPTTAESALQQHREKVVRSCVEWMVGVVERAT
jgi:hypothetical protein